MNIVRHISVFTKNIILLSSLSLIFYGNSWADMTIKDDDLKQFVQYTKTETKPKVWPLPELPEQNEFKLDRQAIMDPFLDYSLDSHLSHGKGNAGVISDTETYAVSKYELINIIKQNNEYYALLKTPDNVVYKKEAGMAIGDKKAIIEKIEKDRLMIKQDDKMILIKQR